MAADKTTKAPISVIVIEVGSQSTRAILFDTVDETYHFIARGEAPTTFAEPWRDVREGALTALRILEQVTGRKLLEGSDKVIVPAQPGGNGVDHVLVVNSAGPGLRVVTVGLLEDVSIESANRLASSLGGEVLESIGLTDRRRLQTQVDAILKVRPDLVIIAGGTEQGATRSTLRMVDMVALALQLAPRDQRPMVLYAGNSTLHKRIKEVLEPLTPLQIAPNLRPAIDMEDLSPAAESAAALIAQVRARQISGLAALANISGSPPLPAPYTIGRVLRFLSAASDPTRPVLGIELGSGWLTTGAGLAGDWVASVQPMGVGVHRAAALEQIPLANLTRWLPMHIPEDVLRDMLWQKTLFPSKLPLSAEELAAEQAFYRELLRLGMQDLHRRAPDLPPYYEPIIVGGMALAGLPTPAQTLLAILDGVQPLGITSLVFDHNSLMASLGAAAALEALIAVQVLESNAFTSLATVITPVSSAREGTPILRMRLETADGSDTRVEVKQGQLLTFPLAMGATAYLTLEPLRGTLVDPRRPRGGRFKVMGGVCGLVVDARGRPVALPADGPQRHELLKRWQLTLGG